MGVNRYMIYMNCSQQESGGDGNAYFIVIMNFFLAILLVTMHLFEN